MIKLTPKREDKIEENLKNPKNFYKKSEDLVKK